MDYDLDTLLENIGEDIISEDHELKVKLILRSHLN